MAVEVVFPLEAPLLSAVHLAVVHHVVVVVADVVAVVAADVVVVADDDPHLIVAFDVPLLVLLSVVDCHVFDPDTIAVDQNLLWT